MTSKDIRDKFIRFFVGKGHKEIAPGKLVPENDPSTLFTSSGMQPLVPYLLGQPHPEGKRLVDSQPSFRSEDIEEVGDNRHTTFFEMLGNWSLGDYWKEEQLSWFFEFLTSYEKGLGLDPKRLYVSVFEGGNGIPKDTESAEIWKRLFESVGIDSKDRISYFGASENWWSRAGVPENMPASEPGGPDSEVFFDFYPSLGPIGNDLKVYSRSGRLLEIGNSVFMQFQKQPDNTFKELPKKNVDFGGGLERLTAAVNDNPDIFQTDLFKPMIDRIADELNVEYSNYKKTIQIVADHLKAAIFLIKDGVLPSNKLQGYLLRRLIRRAVLKAFEINKDFGRSSFRSLVESVVNIYPFYFESVSIEKIEDEISTEVGKFRKTIESGLKKESQIEPQLKKEEMASTIISNNLEQFKISGQDFISSFGFTPKSLASVAAGTVAFELQSTYGLPAEEFRSILQEKNVIPDFHIIEFNKSFTTISGMHQDLSRTASAGMFKGGLADHSEKVIKYHTATHLLHQALRDILGPTVFQKGSNITAERLRFDFSYDKKMTTEEIEKVEKAVSDKIKEDLRVDHLIIPLDKAKEMNAIGLFDEKYAKQVSIYGIGPKYKFDPEAKDTRNRGGYYSLEFCGGPHVKHTKVIGKIKIVKEGAISSGIRRIRAILEV